MSEDHINGNERLSKVETKVENIVVELDGMWKVLREIQATLNRTGKWDWMTVAAVGGLTVTLIGALWAAAIHPISADVDRAALASEKLATAVLVQNQTAETEKIERIKADFEMEKRLLLLEYKTGLLNPKSTP